MFVSNANDFVNWVYRPEYVRNMSNGYKFGSRGNFFFEFVKQKFASAVDRSYP